MQHVAANLAVTPIVMAQVDSVKKAKATSKPQSSGFQKAYNNRPSNKPVFRNTSKHQQASSAGKFAASRQVHSKVAAIRRSLTSDNQRLSYMYAIL